MSELLKPYLVWLHLHPHWAGLAAFLISFAESLAILGLLIPGTVVMTAIGALIGASVLPFASITLCAIVGAIAGDVLSFWLGYHYHQEIRLYWPFRRYPKLLQKGEVFFQQHGGKGIFLGRFIGPIRPVLPLIAGMMSMRPSRFLLFDVISGILWAPAYMLPGILIGAASQELAPETATRLLLYIVAILLLFWCISWLLKRIFQAVLLRIDGLLALGWRALQIRPRWQGFCRWLQDPRRPNAHGQFGLGLLFLLFLSLLVFLAYNVLVHGPLTHWNLPVYHLMRSLRTTLIDQVMVMITFLGEASVISTMWLAVFGWLLLKRYWRAALHWFAAGVLCDISIDGIKHLVQSPRPPGLLQPLHGFSFPSGHSSLSCTLFGFLAVLLSYGRANIWRCLSAIVATVLIVTVVISRLYLGAHWLTDVSGGILLGLSIICLVTLFYCRRDRQALAPIGILAVAIIALLLSWGFYMQRHYLQAVHDYTPYWPSYTINLQKWWQQADKQIPQYRYNRFDQPTEVINLQWAGTLSNIEKNLSAQGWHKASRRTLVVLLSGLMAKNKTEQLPLLSQLYEDRQPVLVMSKYLTEKNTLLVLRLWDAHFKTDTGLPLWLGTVGYHQWRKHAFLKYHHANNFDDVTELLPATQLLIDDLNNFTWQQLHYRKLPPPIKANDPAWNGFVLLIQPKINH